MSTVPEILFPQIVNGYIAYVPDISDSLIESFFLVLV